MTFDGKVSSLMFWVLALAMVALAWTLLCLPMWRRSVRERESQPQGRATATATATATGTGTGTGDAAAERDRVVANVAVLAEQLGALDADLSAGRIDAARHLVAQAELHRRLLDESAGEDQVGGATSLGPAAGTGTSASATTTAGTATSASSGTAAGAAAAAASAPGSATTRRDRRALSIALAVALPAVVIGAYLGLGDPKAFSPSAATSAAVTREPTPEDLAAMVDSLAEGLRRRPDGGRGDLQGWVLLGRSYAAMQRFDDAAKAYAVALDISPDDPQLLADRADMLAMQQGQRLEGEPLRLIERALALDPKQLKALAMAGSAAFERREWAAASGYWQRARKLVEDGSDLAQGLDRSLAEVAAAAGGDGTVVAAAGSSAGSASSAGLPASAGHPSSAGSASVPATTAATAAAAVAAVPASTAPLGAPAATAAVAGTVRLAPALTARVAPGDTVFVFARAARGPRMPLAILRRTAADLPLEFRLDDSMAMSPALKLSAFPDVVIGARVSKSGNALPQPGDLVGEVAAAPGSAAVVQVTIDRVQP